MKVFISSTISDLQLYRDAASKVALKAGWHPILLPDQQTVPFGMSVRRCIDAIRACDAFVSLIGNRCGWVPSTVQGGNGTTSIVELELATWISVHRQHQVVPPPIIFLSNGTTEVPDSSEDAVARAQQTLLRHRLRGQGTWLHSFDLVDSEAKESVAVKEFETNLAHQLHNTKHWIDSKRQELERRHHATELAMQQLDTVAAQRSATENAVLALVIGGLIGVALASDK